MGWVGAPTSGFVQPDGHSSEEYVNLRVRASKMILNRKNEIDFDSIVIIFESKSANNVTDLFRIDDVSYKNALLAVAYFLINFSIDLFDDVSKRVDSAI
jgi:hypothetical protein